MQVECKWCGGTFNREPHNGRPKVFIADRAAHLEPHRKRPVISASSQTEQPLMFWKDVQLKAASFFQERRATQPKIETTDVAETVAA